MSALLEVVDLHVAYGKVEAVHGVSLDGRRRARIVTVIGPNGAGKTTLLAAIMGLLPSRGAIAIRRRAGRTASRVEERVARGSCLVPERRELFAAMTVADNLELGAFQRASRRAIATLGDTLRRGLPALSRACTSAARSSPARCRAASARCWRSAAR